MNLNQKFITELSAIEEWCTQYFTAVLSKKHPGYEKLIESIQYSLEAGGKRFRPLLSVLVAKALGHPIEKVKAVAMAVEFIHTYSLIHDDLPCMDDDDKRRGKPSNHKVFGEDMALLAGDALLTESFVLLARDYSDQPEVVSESVRLIGEAAGFSGMVGGQSMDIVVPDGGQSFEQITWVHELKTGRLIQVSMEAAAVACGADTEQRKLIAEIGQKLGFAFQLADDIDDYDIKNPETTSYCVTMGYDKTLEKLKSLTSELLHLCEQVHSSELQWLSEFNQNRVLATELELRG